MWAKLPFVLNAHHEYYEAMPINVVPISGESNCRFFLGGIDFVLVGVDFYAEPNKAKSNKTRVASVSLRVESPDQYRAFWAAIKDKYSESYDSDNGSKWCSDYSCFSGKYGTIKIRTTPYVVSILDAVKVDSSYF